MIIYTPGIIAIVALTWGFAGLGFGMYIQKYSEPKTDRQCVWQILLCGPIVWVLFVCFVIVGESSAWWARRHDN